MSIVRQDAWTNDEDLILAEVVLRHIREGSTQLAAFDEVGERLSRTSAACGFRWNSTIRKKYEAAIAIAKKQRKNLKKTKLDNASESAPIDIDELIPKVEGREANVEPSLQLNFDVVIDFLISQKEILSSKSNLVSSNNELTEKIVELTEENEKLRNELMLLKDSYAGMKQDYQLLIDIMDRAKQMSIANG